VVAEWGYHRAMRAGELNPWWRVGVPLVGWLVPLLFRVRVDGIEHVPSSGAAVIAFNHVSVLDGPVVAVVVAKRLKREARFLVAAEMFERPVVGWILDRYDQIPVRRGERDAAALDEAVATVKRGALAALAPEGRVNDDSTVGDLQRIRSGVGRIALPTGAPIVPLGIWGTQRRWPRPGLTWASPWRPVLALSFGAPILPSGDVSNSDDVQSVSERVGERLQAQVAVARAAAGDADA
jgi:1-acyl-sn-glycerol-3-phosphate acyltransferase